MSYFSHPHPDPDAPYYPQPVNSPAWCSPPSHFGRGMASPAQPYPIGRPQPQQVGPPYVLQTPDRAVAATLAATPGSERSTRRAHHTTPPPAVIVDSKAQMLEAITDRNPNTKDDVKFALDVVQTEKARNEFCEVAYKKGPSAEEAAVRFCRGVEAGKANMVAIREELEQTKKWHEKEKARVEKQVAEDIDRKVKETQKKIEDIKAAAEKRIADMKTAAEKRIADMKTDGKKRTEDLETALRDIDESIQTPLNTTNLPE